MPGIAIIGAQFGDEGKGKITDFFAENADVVARFNGGNNAGHTVVVGSKKYKLHHVPSGVFQGKEAMMAAGMAIDPRVLEKEMQQLPREPMLLIDPRAHVIMPYHNALDEAMESANGNVTGAGRAIGTTRRGIGPCYADRALRTGIRFEDLVDEKRLREKLNAIFPLKKKILEQAYGMKIEFTAEQMLKEYSALGKKFSKYLGDVSLAVSNALAEGKNVMFEGAQGTFLDNDFGTYPYVTSSHPISAGIGAGVGIPPASAQRVIGVAKAYTTRVGSGPFPTELSGALADKIREKGGEYGTTTGRPRRVGWLDLAMLRTAQRLNGFTEISITKLDVLGGIGKLKVCTSYSLGGKKLGQMPCSLDELEKCRPNYAEFEGFALSGKEKRYNDLPKAARDYVEMIGYETRAPVKVVSVGAERTQTLVC